MNFEIFKKHPYWSAGGGVAIFVLFYLLFKGRSSGGASGASPSQMAQLDEQQANINAAETAAQMQQQGQIAIAGINAGVQSKAIDASQAVQTQQSSDALSAIEAQFAAQSHESDNAAAVSETQFESLAEIVDEQYQAQIAKSADVLDYLENQTNAQRDVAIGQQEIDKTALSHVTDVGGSQNRTSIIESAMGNEAGSVAAENGATASAVSGNQTTASIAGGITGALAALFT